MNDGVRRRGKMVGSSRFLTESLSHGAGELLRFREYVQLRDLSEHTEASCQPLRPIAMAIEERCDSQCEIHSDESAVVVWSQHDALHSDPSQAGY